MEIRGHHREPGIGSAVRLRRSGPSSAPSAPGLVIAGGYARGHSCPLRVPRPPPTPDPPGILSTFEPSAAFLCISGGRWPRFPPGVTAAMTKASRNVRSRRPRPPPPRAEAILRRCGPSLPAAHGQHLNGSTAQQLNSSTAQQLNSSTAPARNRRNDEGLPQCPLQKAPTSSASSRGDPSKVRPLPSRRSWATPQRLNSSTAQQLNSSTAQQLNSSRP
mgnify:CR=1 FL=1